MSKPLSSYPEWERPAVAARRVHGMGLGALAALDFFKETDRATYLKCLIEAAERTSKAAG